MTSGSPEFDTCASLELPAEGLRVPQRAPTRRLRTSTVPDMPKADAPNNVWAADFQFDATTDGRPIKIVSIDEHTRECVSGLVERSVIADVFIDELDRLVQRHGYPALLSCDNGPELACVAMADWPANASGCHSSRPANPGAAAMSSRSTPVSATTA